MFTHENSKIFFFSTLRKSYHLIEASFFFYYWWFLLTFSDRSNLFQVFKAKQGNECPKTEV